MTQQEYEDHLLLQALFRYNDECAAIWDALAWWAGWGVV